MFDDRLYPDYVQIKFEKYYQNLRENLNWSMVLPKFFKSNKLKKAHGAVYVHCPFHGEKTASMRFSFSRQIFHCYGCGIGGNLLTFIIKMEGGFFEAMLFIRKHFQIHLPYSRKEWRKIKAEMLMIETRKLNSYMQDIAIEEYGISYELEDDEFDYMELGKMNFELSCIELEESYLTFRDNQVLDVPLVQKNIIIPSASLNISSSKEEKIVLPEIDDLCLKQLIIARHGNYDKNLRLSDGGRQQMEKLSVILQEKILFGDALLISSTAPRASDSADVLEKNLPFDSREDAELFWSDSGHDWDIKAAHEIILERGSKYDVIVIVSHLEYCEYLPWYFMKKVFGIDAKNFSMNKGDACLLSIDERTLIKL